MCRRELKVLCCHKQPLRGAALHQSPFPQAMLHFWTYSSYFQDFNCYILRETAFTLARCFFSNLINTRAQRNCFLDYLSPNLTKECLPYLSPALILRSSKLCSRLVFVCFMWISQSQRHLYLTVFTNSSLWCRGPVFTVSRCWPLSTSGRHVKYRIDPLNINLGIRCWESLVSSSGFFITRNIVPGTDWVRD
jgi:hypothetical protein